MAKITRKTKVTVMYDNPYYGEHEQYEATIGQIEQDTNGDLNAKALIERLAGGGVAIMKNGPATTTVALPGLLVGDESLEGGN